MPRPIRSEISRSRLARQCPAAGQSGQGAAYPRTTATRTAVRDPAAWPRRRLVVPEDRRFAALKSHAHVGAVASGTRRVCSSAATRRRRTRRRRSTSCAARLVRGRSNGISWPLEARHEGFSLSALRCWGCVAQKGRAPSEQRGGGSSPRSSRRSWRDARAGLKWPTSWLVRPRRGPTPRTADLR